MTVDISLVQDTFGCWIVAAWAVLVLWIWQKWNWNEGPLVLSIEPDEAQLRKQKVFIQKPERLRLKA